MDKGTLDGARIIIIDDHRDLADNLSELLADEGASVRIAADASTGIARSSTWFSRRHSTRPSSAMPARPPRVFAKADVSSARSASGTKRSAQSRPMSSWIGTPVAAATAGLACTTSPCSSRTSSSAATASTIVEIDPERVKQILLNLVRNALDAATQRVVVRVRRDGAGACLCVTDDGPGISPENRARIFEPFFTTKEGGTGLGMAIVHSLVERHGGTIEIHSDHGTTVAISLQRRVP